MEKSPLADANADEIDDGSDSDYGGGDDGSRDHEDL